MSIVFVCVNYYSDKETLRLVEEIFKQKVQKTVNIVLVDNTPRDKDDDFYTVLPAKNRAISYIKTSSNIGYFGAARYGLDKFLEENNLPEWIIVSNVDYMFNDTGFLSRLSEFDCEKDVGIIAPSMRSALSGRDLNPYLASRPSFVRMHFYKWLTRYYPLLAVYGYLFVVKHSIASVLRRSHSSDAKQIEIIYAPQGACIVFNKRYFEKGGTLDYPCFLFGEEIFVAETARELGLKVIYNPDLKIIHEEHYYSGRELTRRIAGYIAESAAYCADRYFRSGF